MEYNSKRALELLRIGSGRADATFRDGQEEMQSAILLKAKEACGLHHQAAQPF